MNAKARLARELAVSQARCTELEGAERKASAVAARLEAAGNVAAAIAFGEDDDEDDDDSSGGSSGSDIVTRSHGTKGGEGGVREKKGGFHRRKMARALGAAAAVTAAGGAGTDGGAPIVGDGHNNQNLLRSGGNLEKAKEEKVKEKEGVVSFSEDGTRGSWGGNKVSTRTGGVLHGDDESSDDGDDDYDDENGRGGEGGKISSSSTKKAVRREQLRSMFPGVAAGLARGGDECFDSDGGDDDDSGDDGFELESVGGEGGASVKRRLSSSRVSRRGSLEAHLTEAKERERKMLEELEVWERLRFSFPVLDSVSKNRQFGFGSWR